MGIFELPGGFREIKSVDIQKDKKLSILVTIGSLAIFAVLFFLGTKITPFSFEINENNAYSLLFSSIGLFAAMVLYLIAHELVHGFFFKRYSGKKAYYGFTGLYAYAGCDAYIARREYIISALAPVVSFGLLFLLLNILLPSEYFWWVYFLQLINLSGAAGDLYITILICTLPDDILIRDKGVCMHIYSRKE